MKCLIIDDDEIYVFALQHMIKNKELADSFELFENGKEALDYLQENQEVLQQPHVVFLDLNMPVMDGFEFLDQIEQTELKGKIKLYVLSSSISETDIERAKSHEDVEEYFVKPVSLDDLYSIFEGRKTPQN